ncbi:MAG: DUF309 domain-containing protein [Pirellulales bacterium]
MDSAQYDPLYLKGIELFNTCEFFEAHEAWEELWQEHFGPDRKFYQGLIQAAVAVHHFCNGNIRGAKRCTTEAAVIWSRIVRDISAWISTNSLPT